jgi:hypothetical protein
VKICSVSSTPSSSGGDALVTERAGERRTSGVCYSTGESACDSVSSSEERRQMASRRR